uniref:J domain-containing protein n=1 Tax=Noctiluca scintillans TaxID=2966 RepID=A0A7S1A2T0_NOCSC|mmetsp:Transcript_28504/g.75235  ORF Transcript_28504/g.75235 Transcript_28504/m.75235 type:complete len:200 (+) Transcript_28504:55-654(+)
MDESCCGDEDEDTWTDTLESFFAKADAYHPSHVVAYLQRRFLRLEQVPTAPSLEDPFAVLQLPRDSGDVEVRRAYRRLALVAHPDKPNGDAATFQRIAGAYEVLRDPVQRAKYQERRDSSLREMRVVLRPRREVVRDVVQDVVFAMGSVREWASQMWHCGEEQASVCRVRSCVRRPDLLRQECANGGRSRDLSRLAAFL